MNLYPASTEKFIKGFWNAHVYDWEQLEISRHGQEDVLPEKIWDHNYADPVPFRETIGLSFLSAGNDLIYSALILYKLSKDKGALKWAKRLAAMYQKARHSETGLGVYMYTQPLQRDGPIADEITTSRYVDRAKRQFGPEFGEIALEGNVIFGGQSASIYVRNALMELQLTSELDGVNEFIDWTCQGLKNYYKYAYLPGTNMLKPLLADGTDMSSYVLVRDGYYGKKGQVITPFPADSRYFYSYSRAVRYGDEELCFMISNIMQAYNLGTIKDLDGQVEINGQTTESDPLFIFGLIELFNLTENENYLRLAEVIADNIVKYKFNQGFFLEKGNKFASFDVIELLAILELEAVLQKESEKVPYFIDGIGSQHFSRHYKK